MKPMQLILCFACLTTCITARASDVSPFLEPSTVAVARVDLSQVEVTALVEKIHELSPEMIPSPAQTTVNLIGGGLVAALKREGVDHVYATLSTLDIFQLQVAVFVPTNHTQRVSEALSAIMTMLPAEVNYQVAQVEGGVLIAPPQVLERLRQRPAANRPDLEQALVETPATVTLAVGLRDDLRQSVVNLLADVPPGEVPIDFSPKQIAADLQSVTLQLSAPELKLSALAFTADASASERLRTLVQQYVALVLPTAKIELPEETTLSLVLNQAQLLTLLPALSQANSQTMALMQQSNNLKQVVLAMHNFEATYGVLPPRMSVAEDGTPLLSWRVHLLPYLDQQALYDEFHLDEPWDSPHNIQLINRIPPPYQSLEHNDLQPGYTCVQQPLSRGSFWFGNEPKLSTLRDVRDGTSNTLAFAITLKQNAVPWSKPDDLTVDLDQPLESLFGDRQQMILALLDGSVQTLDRSETSADRIRAALTHQGSEVLSLKE